MVKMMHFGFVLLMATPLSACVSVERSFKGRETGDVLSKEIIAKKAGTDRYEITVIATDEDQLSAAFKVERISTEIQTTAIHRQAFLVYEIRKECRGPFDDGCNLFGSGPGKTLFGKREAKDVERVGDKKDDLIMAENMVELARSPVASGTLEVVISPAGDSPTHISVPIKNGVATAVIPRNAVEKIASSNGREARFTATFGGAATSTEVSLDRYRADMAHQELDKAATAEIAALTDAKKHGATHVLQPSSMYVRNGSLFERCHEDLDGSMICRHAEICGIEPFIAALKSHTEVSADDCEHGRVAEDFVFEPKGKSVKIGDGQAVRAVRRGPNTMLTNRYGAQIPAATWMEVGAPRSAKKGTLAH